MTNELLALERAALDRWGRGDPDGYLELSAPDVTYFDPFLDARLDGRDALGAWYATIRGKIRIDRDEIVGARAQALGADAAVLTFNYVSHGSEGAKRWSCSEVYQRSGGAWRIVHTHWSLTPAR